MELHCKHIFVRHRGTERFGVIRSADYFRLRFGVDEVTVHKIKTVVVFDTLPHRMWSALLYTVPAHVWHFEQFTCSISLVIFETPDLAGKQTYTVDTAVLFAALHQG